MLRTDSIPKSTSLLVVCSTVIAVLMLMTLESPAQVNQQSKTVRVFILAGQSNMQGHGVVDLDHPEHYNGGKGNLESAMKKKANSKRMRHLKDSNGNWSVRDDVFCWYQTENELKTGGLTIGFSGYSGAPHHFGPELQLGHVLGDAFDDPVLLIKTAWGGKSLANDFRPPSSKAELGPYYIKMLRQIGAAINQFESKIPQLKGYKPIIEGFVWQQGWNDMIDDQATAEYEQNLRHLISDLRQQFGVDGLPFVIGELGNGGEKTNQKMKRFRAAQMAAARHGDRNVAFVKTTHCARPANQSPNQGH
ncbi:MAG: sialate O-acetylesterase, partial [Planctomycetota bacterium]